MSIVNDTNAEQVIAPVADPLAETHTVPVVKSCTSN